jgi:ABC-type Zn uptake system ZnuABC Zn-binding protein ZnuA
MVRARSALAFFTLFLVACSPAAEDDGLPLIVTTVSPITNIVHNIAGERARVFGLVPEGVNSHTFEPAPSDARRLADADLVFMNGLHLEEPTRELAEANLRSGVRIVRLADETIAPSEYIFDFSFPKSGGDPNPHLWTHPLHAKRYAEIVATELKRLDPPGAPTFDANLAAFSARIDALDAAVIAATETVPASARKLLTYHDSFPYFARHYGWTVIGAIQPADFAEPTPREVARLIEQVRAAKVPAIFGSEVFASPVLAQIARETGARYVDDLRDDDLPGEAGDPEHSYLALMVFDFRTIVTALGGDASAFDSIDTSNIAGEGMATYR